MYVVVPLVELLVQIQRLSMVCARVCVCVFVVGVLCMFDSVLND